MLKAADDPSPDRLGEAIANRRELDEPPSRSSIYRCLLRHRLIGSFYAGSTTK